MNLVILPAALAELGDAAAFYAASANAELGLAFVDEFEHAVNVILANPKIGAVFRSSRRRYLLQRFPYSVIYQLSENDIRIIASRISEGGQTTGYAANDSVAVSFTASVSRRQVFMPIRNMLTRESFSRQCRGELACAGGRLRGMKGLSSGNRCFQTTNDLASTLSDELWESGPVEWHNSREQGARHPA